MWGNIKKHPYSDNRQEEDHQLLKDNTAVSGSETSPLFKDNKAETGGEIHPV